MSRTADQTRWPRFGAACQGRKPNVEPLRRRQQPRILPTGDSAGTGSGPFSLSEPGVG